MKGPFPAYEGTEPYVFVCYAHADAALVYPEIGRLCGNGFNIWYDEGINPGTEWSETLAQHIRNCAAFLYYLTPRSVGSGHCRREVNFAVGQPCRMLAVHLEPTGLPDGLKLTLSDRQAILSYEHARRDYEDRLDRALRGAIGGIDGHANPAREVLQIGDWRLDVGSQRLTRADEVAALDPKEMAVLLHLAEHAPNVVTREGLLARTWAGAVVGDNVLHQVVAHLRRALGDDARRPRYIETLPKRGYRLVIAPSAAAPTLADGPIPLRELLPPPPVVAVLELDRQPDLSEFAAVTVDSTVARLSEIKWLKVSRVRSNADYVLSGTVRMVGETVRVSVELERVIDRTVLWTQAFEHFDPKQGFPKGMLIARIVEAVIQQYRIEGALARVVDLAVRTEYRDGMIEWVKFVLGGGGNVQVSIDHLELALKRCPKLWPAVSQLAITYSDRHPNLSLAQAVEKAHAHGRALLALRYDNIFRVPVTWAFAIACIGERLDLDYEFAEANFLLSIDQDQNWGQVNTHLGSICAARGRLGTALDHYEAAVQGDAQLNQMVTLTLIAWTRIAAGHYDIASRLLREHLRRLTVGSVVHFSCQTAQVVALWHAGETNRAAALLDEAWREYGHRHAERFPWLFALLGREAEAQDLLKKTEQRHEESTLREYWGSSMGYYFLGDFDRAFEWLNRAIDNREARYFSHLRRAPYLDRLRQDTRFDDAMRRLEEIEARGSPLREAVTGPE